MHLPNLVLRLGLVNMCLLSLGHLRVGYIMICLRLGNLLKLIGISLNIVQQSGMILMIFQFLWKMFLKCVMLGL